MPTKTLKPKEHSASFMLAEFSYLKESFEGAMKWREERYRSFITIIFGITALLAAISQMASTGTAFIYAVAILSFILYIYGLLVFSRLATVHFTLEEQKNAINRVREYFVHLDSGIASYLLTPFTQKSPTITMKLGSGLLGTTAITNSFLLTICGTTVLWGVLNRNIIIATGCGLILGVISRIGHSIFFRNKSKREQR
jgi:hypothetical protein